ncbi:MAG: hypothetical protein ACUVUQ_08990 [Thermodesulfovibrionales bacterium]
MKNTIKDFLKAAQLADTKISESQISIQVLGCPHKPQGLPKGKMAIYAFKFNERFLKIGKAGPNSDARFRSQPYNPKSSQSNLAKSILNDTDMQDYKLNEKNIKDWIKNHVERIDIILDESLGIFVLNFLEAFLHCKLKPKYEGFDSQR